MIEVAVTLPPSVPPALRTSGWGEVVVRGCPKCRGAMVPDYGKSDRRCLNCGYVAWGMPVVVVAVREAPASYRRCEVAGCDGQHLARGFCRAHYIRERRRVAGGLTGAVD